MTQATAKRSWHKPDAARWRGRIGDHHELVCRECFVRVDDAPGAVVADDAAVVRFLEVHVGHNIARRVKMPPGWAVIDGALQGDGGFPEAA